MAELNRWKEGAECAKIAVDFFFLKKKKEIGRVIKEILKQEA